ncbi:MAG: LysR family transcriptional regulator [Selenomonadaceae bacterium]|nr:LysR family transcriptional regulator [Selenomonadaceae bacterium]MBQ7493854.1 LysR family transcriptional regulator [Selenomonadaceae bacterium]
MGIKDMRAFFAIVEEGNISHAAQRLGIAQPALSRQMKHLEENLHVKLFERGSRRIRLTEAGQVLYSRVESILGMVDGTVREITEIGSGTKGTVRIGTITTSGAMILPDLIAEFRKIYPDVVFEIWEAEGARILELLDSRLIEVAITRTQVDNLAYELLVLPNEPLVMVMNSQNVCGKDDKTIKLEELKNQPLIIPLRWKSNFIAACKRLDFDPQIICVSDSIVQDLLMVKMNLGAAMIPVSSKRLLTDGNLVYKRIVEPEMTTHTVVAWRKNQTLSTACKNFIDLFKKLFIKEEIVL